MDKKLEQTPDKMGEQPDNFSPADATADSASRRKFTRAAVTGSAVLLSLSNRAVWSASADCVSEQTWASFYNPGAASISPKTISKIEALQTKVETTLDDTGARTLEIAEVDGDMCPVPKADGTGGVVEEEKCWKGNPNAPGRGDTKLCED